MAKRRRERDRPKAGPDAYYNPNKRVLLSYASDDDPGEVEDDGLRDAQLANYQIDEYPAEEKEPGLGVEDVVGGCAEDIGNAATSHQHPPTESKSSKSVETNSALSTQVKRQVGGKEREELEAVDAEPAVEAEQEACEDKQQEVQDAGSGAGQIEHPRRSDGDWKVNSRRDTSTGQFLSLGGLVDDYGEEDREERYDSTTEDAMAYLESVKIERQGIPEILSAMRSVQTSECITNIADDEDISFDENAFHDDEAYIGAPTSETLPLDDPTDPQYAFTQSLKERFLFHRSALHLPPTVESLTALGSAYPISFPLGNAKAYTEWHRLLSSKPPRLAQLQSLEQDTISSLLALVQKNFLVKGKNVKKNTSSWIWSLLARSEEVGNMTNDEVFPLRELGKKAVLVQLSLADPDAAEALEQAGNEDEDMAKEPALKATAKVGALPDSFVTENTKATLDMILVVVGDVFGQRDLLEFRQTWTPAAQAPG